MWIKFPVYSRKNNNNRNFDRNQQTKRKDKNDQKQQSKIWNWNATLSTKLWHSAESSLAPDLFLNLISKRLFDFGWEQSSFTNAICTGSGTSNRTTSKKESSQPQNDLNKCNWFTRFRVQLCVRPVWFSRETLGRTSRIQRDCGDFPCDSVSLRLT